MQTISLFAAALSMKNEIWAWGTCIVGKLLALDWMQGVYKLNTSSKQTYCVIRLWAINWVNGILAPWFLREHEKMLWTLYVCFALWESDVILSAMAWSRYMHLEREVVFCLPLYNYPVPLWKELHAYHVHRAVVYLSVSCSRYSWRTQGNTIAIDFFSLLVWHPIIYDMKL